MTDTTIKYGVTGATGHLGRLAIAELLKTVPAANVVALVRSADKAKDLAAQGVEVRVAHYDQPDTLATALKGIGKLLLISSNELQASRSAQHGRVVEAAKAAGVQRIVYTSILHAATTTNVLAPDHKASEEAIMASGIPYSLMRHGWYTENYLDTARQAEKSGVILTSAHDGKVSSATRADYAAADVKALLGDEGNQTYELAGDSAWNFMELAETLGRIFGRDVTVKDVDTATHVQLLMGYALDEGMANFVAALDASIAAGELENNDRVLSKMIGRPTTSLEAGLRAGLGVTA